MKVEIQDFSYLENSFIKNGREYKVTDLIESSKDLPVFNLPLSGVDIGNFPWGNINIKSFVFHFKRVQSSDISYPIILDDEGFVCDGWHRIAKAIIEGHEFIKAKRLIVMPEAVNTTVS